MSDDDAFAILPGKSPLRCRASARISARLRADAWTPTPSPTNPPIPIMPQFSPVPASRPLILVRRIRPLTLLLAIVGLGGTTGWAASATWTGGTGTQAWSNGANWSTDPAVPGATSGTTNADVATFNTATAGTNVTIDAGRNIRTLTFGAGAGVFTIGETTANTGEALSLSSSGNITLETGVTATTTINAPLILQPASSSTAGTSSFNNSAISGADTTASTPKLNFAGDISGGTTSAGITLTLAGTVGTRNGSNSASALTSANTISGVISDGGATNGLAVTINGTNTSSSRINAWNLTGANTFSGNVTLTTGTLYFNSLANIGQASALGTGSKGTISVAGNGFLIYTGGAATSNRTITAAGGSLFNNGTGLLTLDGAITNTSGIVLRGNNAITVNGLISGPASLTKTNGNLLTLTNAANSFAGSVNLSAGMISVASLANGGLNSPLGAGNTILIGQNQTSDNIATLRFTGASGGATNRTFILQSGSANTVGSPATAILENTVAGQTLTLNGNFRSNGSVLAAADYFGAIELIGAGHGVYSGILGGLSGGAFSTTPTNIKLTKSGLGTWELSAANIYYGTTTVSAGKLHVSGSLNGTRGVSVAGNATLSGNGTIRPGDGANVSATAQVSVAANGILAPGGTSTIGALTLDSSSSTAANILNLASSAKMQLRLDTGLQSDRISLLNGSANDILFGGNNVINFTDLTAGTLAVGNYTLFTADVASAYSGLTLDGQTITGGLAIGSGLEAYSGSTLAVSGDDIVLQLIPEPTSAVLLGFGLLVFATRRTRSGGNHR